MFSTEGKRFIIRVDGNPVHNFSPHIYIAGKHRFILACTIRKDELEYFPSYKDAYLITLFPGGFSGLINRDFGETFYGGGDRKAPWGDVQLLCLFFYTRQTKERKDRGYNQLLPHLLCGK